MEKLKQWLKDHNMTGAEFAAAIGVQQACVSLWLTGLRFPRPENMQKITEYTGGEVTPNDFYNK